MRLPRENPSSLRVIAFGLIAFFCCQSTRVLAQIGDFQPSDLQVVDDVCGKQIVVLGELPSHGEARSFQAKARIVEELVGRCGFDTLLFEAPVYDFLGLQQAKAENRALPEQLEHAIGGFWVTVELSSWRTWLFSEFSADNLYLGGLDDQVSATSHFARATLPRLVASSTPSNIADACQQRITRNLFWRYDSEHGYDDEEKVQLKHCATTAAIASALQSGRDGDTIDQLMLENLANLYSRQQGEVEALDRDEMMYRNLRWHQERLPEKSKVVVWTATVHAARRQAELGHKPMGTWLSEHWSDRLAVIGFSAFSGQSAMAGMPSRPIPEAAAGSLEAVATKSDTSWVYLDKSALREMGSIPSRLFGRVTSAEWSTVFDGVLVIRKEVAPTFESK